MSEAWGIFIVSALIAVSSYMSKNFMFEPLLEYRKTKGKIQNRLKYNANIITNGEFPKEIIKPIRSEIRDLSCELEEKYSAISFGKHFPTFLNIPSKQDVSEAAKQLIFLSNSTGTKNVLENNDSIDIVKSKLRIS